jgi:hypothetical protein
MATTKAPPRPWTPEEDALIAARYGVLSGAELGRELDRSSKSVCNRARRLGLSTPKPRGDQLPGLPLVEAIEKWALRADVVNLSSLVSFTNLESWRAGTVSGHAADRWPCRMDLLWFDVWPEDEVARMYFEGPAE